MFAIPRRDMEREREASTKANSSSDATHSLSPSPFEYAVHGKAFEHFKLCPMQGLPDNAMPLVGDLEKVSYKPNVI